MIKNLVYTEEMNRILARNKKPERRFNVSFALESLLKSEYFTELSTYEREFLLNTNEREFLTHYDT